MKTLIRAIVVLQMTALVPAAEQCATCKCTEYPVPGSCSKCCGVASGTITAATGSSVTIKTGDGAEHVFSVNSETRTDHNWGAPGKHEEGARATVIFNKETKVAGAIRGEK